jgi:hypothetical protein
MRYSAGVYGVDAFYPFVLFSIALLKECVTLQGKELKTTSGSLRPFGEKRLRIIELFSSLLNTANSTGMFLYSVHNLYKMNRYRTNVIMKVS